ncbi:hypothetical protein A2U01_0112323, partial [Trifolium medium]|nr:hypothetical protein [Trifolium medium]
IPKKLLTSEMLRGCSQFNTASTLDGSTDTPP